MNTLLIDGLEFTWPGAKQPTLHVKRMTLEPGKSMFLSGPSGCGKSTLLSSIAGIVDIKPNMVNVAGVDVGGLHGGARDRFRVDHIGLIFQVFNLLPWLSASDNILLPTRFSKTRRSKAGSDPDATACRLMRELGLDDKDLATTPAGDLSVGQQQRVAAARALIGAPALILADEPTSALDEDRKLDFVNLLTRECAAAGSALLFVSHDRSLEDRFDQSVRFSDLNDGWAKTC